MRQSSRVAASDHGLVVGRSERIVGPYTDGAAQPVGGGTCLADGPPR